MRYHAQKLKPLIQMIASIVKKNPEALGNPEYLIACLVNTAPSLGQQDRCFNCDASMEEYTFQFDVLDALMLIGMANIVRENTKQWANLGFTECNKVHVPSMENVTYAMKSRTTQMSKLGLVAKVMMPGNTQARGRWCITKRGWAALRGESVPKTVVSWHGKIEERPNELTTLQEALNTHIVWVEEAEARNKKPRKDYRTECHAYSADEWAGFENIYQSTLL